MSALAPGKEAGSGAFLVNQCKISRSALTRRKCCPSIAIHKKNFAALTRSKCCPSIAEDWRQGSASVAAAESRNDCPCTSASSKGSRRSKGSKPKGSRRSGRVTADKGGGEFGPGREASFINCFAPGGQRWREAIGMVVRNAIGNGGDGVDRRIERVRRCGEISGSGDERRQRGRVGK